MVHIHDMMPHHTMRAALVSMMFFAYAGAASAASTSVLLPSADGFYKQWTPSAGATHYTLVDETVCNGVTDYNRTTTVGQRDSYAVSLASIPNNATIQAITLAPCASRHNGGGGGSATMNLFYRFAGVNSADAGAYAVTGTTPVSLASTTFSGLSFTKVASSTLEVGAVYTAGTRGVRLSRLATVITYILPSVPSAPSGLDATNVSGTQNTLTWTDTATNEDGFFVERSLNNQFGPFTQVATTSANSATYNDISLTTNQTYYYRVRAYNTGGNSAYSNTDYAITATVAPSAPFSMSLSATTTGVLVVWNASSTNEEGFIIERSTNSLSGPFTQIATTTLNVTSILDTTASANQTYYYRVRAFNAVGFSGYSNTEYIITATLAPSAPTTLDVTNLSGTQNILTWSDNSTNEGGYSIERSINSLSGPFTQIATTSFNVATYTDSTVLSNQTYYYRVRAYNVIGNSGYSNTDYAITATVAPNIPTLYLITASSTAAHLFWSDTALNEEGVKIERSLDNISFSEVGTAGINNTSYSDFGLSSGTYYYQIRAYNTIGNSGYSSSTSVVIP